jgi:hypothetical protein
VVVVVSGRLRTEVEAATGVGFCTISTLLQVLIKAEAKGELNIRNKQ